MFDFIVVGAGPSGCVVASRIANTPAAPSVLLLEAGGDNQSAADLSGAERFNVAFSPGSPYNWNYKTAPQTQLSGQSIDYSRGRGLGGSTAINFCGWTVGSRDDYDEWAAVVGDDRFGWRNVSQCLRRIERLHSDLPVANMRRYVDPDIKDHGTTGRLDLSYGESWNNDLSDMFDATEQVSLPLNKDINSGDRIGLGMGPVCIHRGRRLTAADAYLRPAPLNLTIMSDAPIAKVLFDGTRATGVRTVAGTVHEARREVVISGGALNTPQILKLSGIGPSDELHSHGIGFVRNLPLVGSNLQDHCFSALGIALRPSVSGIGGPQSPSPMGWFKLPSLDDTFESRSLPARVQAHRLKPTVPDFEVATHTPPLFIGHEPEPDTEFLGAICLVMNPQSRGTVTLQSSDPEAAPLIDPKFLSHPFDRRLLIEGMRETRRILSAPVYAARTVKTYFPEGDSDEAIWVSCTTVDNLYPDLILIVLPPEPHSE
ncbi:hypothetical protein LTR53_005863 [Teratosphaeriaceae sp. CCFEE 6253]|nr:hypothetical protein LTR53_005863 [Teratosphaeriaceae sp. CCFEE 6253]